MIKGNFYRINGITYKCVGGHFGPFNYTIYLEDVDTSERLYIVEQSPEEEIAEIACHYTNIKS